MGTNDIHVVPHGKEWAVRREGSDRVLSLHPTQAQAVEAGRPIARREHGELVTHRPDGQFRDSDSYGNDPNPPKDRKH